ncbi:hypothetical protein Cni_G07567 [Canna indica]|uniref:Uncharacterized protein n=1 Tax=Canna indica TaxID=4628 RepID=A0AAQ3K480_9LILI|nr:hypothetical protein Cni_G07567 [Canna indica]
MRMAADHNLNFNYGGVFPPSFSNQNVVSFQPGTVNNAAGLMSEGMYSSGDVSSMAGMILPGNTGTQNNTSAMITLPANLSGNIVLDPVPPLKHGPAMSVGWSLEELYVLRQGLIEYATEPNIMKYIKIAAKLPEKTVRDVAMRCQCMTKESGKRRKVESYYTEKMVKECKEKMVHSSSISTMHSVQSENMATFASTMLNVSSNSQLSHRASPINIETQRLIFENVNLLNQIGSNLQLNKVQDNADLFCRARDNITSILNCMSGTPGIMSQMPSLPVSLDDNLFQSILPLPGQVHLPGSIHLKEEPRYW